MIGDIDDNSKIIFLISQQKRVVTPNETVLMMGHKICFLWRNMANYL